MQKSILLLGAGKSATALIDYLIQNAPEQNWRVRIGDINVTEARKKLGSSAHGEAFGLDVSSDHQRSAEIRASDLVISLLPATLHFQVAKDCLKHGVNLLTASYIDDDLKKMAKEIEAKKLIFLCEMGLDPGIDHMSAKKLIDEIQEDGGRITSFLSHCGGLVSKESDQNSWHYKISWNPRNVVTAGRAGASFRYNGDYQILSYPELFKTLRVSRINGYGNLAWYPNRDSLSYQAIYDLNECASFIRTTLRHADFIEGWSRLIELELTADDPLEDIEGRPLAEGFKMALKKKDFPSWLSSKINSNLEQQSGLLEELNEVVDREQDAIDLGLERHEDLLVVDDTGVVKTLDADHLKLDAAARLGEGIHKVQVMVAQLVELGLNDQQTIVPSGINTVSGLLQFALETKLALQPDDKDLVVMQHEIEFVNSGRKYLTTSTLLKDGESASRTGMAQTVGWPLGIAAKLILNNQIRKKGLLIPIVKEIYQPVLKELETMGVVFVENTTDIL